MSGSQELAALEERLRRWLSSELKVLDVRSRDSYQAERLVRSHNVPSCELKVRLFELPDKGAPFAVLEAPGEPNADGQCWSAWLEAHGWRVDVVLHDTEVLWAAARSSGCVESGAPRAPTLLFSPCPPLASSIALIEQELGASSAACLDIGCGSGRDMIYLATRSRVCADACAWHVCGLDNWKGAVHRASAAASTYGVADRVSVCPVHIDGQGNLHPLPLDRVPAAKSASPAAQPADSPPRRPGESNPPGSPSRGGTIAHGGDAAASDACADGRGAESLDKAGNMVANTRADARHIDSLSRREHQLVVCVRFLQRALFPQMRAWVAPGGFVLVSTFVKDDALGPEIQRLYPKGEEHVLAPGELAQHFGPLQHFEIVRDGIFSLPDGRKVTEFLARKADG